MGYYYKNEEGHLVPTTLKDMLILALDKGGFTMDNGAFIDEGHHWIGIVQKSEGKKPKKIVSNFSFDETCNIVKDHNIYITPIITIEDDDNSSQLI